MLPNFVSRRELLRRSGTGLGALGLAGLLSDEGLLSRADAATEAAAPDTSLPLSPKQPHFPARAKHVVHLFMNGGPSQVDTFDPKPMLDKYHGQPLPVQNLRTERKTGHAMKSPFAFKKYGQSGIEVSDLFARTAAHIDDMCIIRSMQAEVPNHEPSLMMMNCGNGRIAVPSMGAWVTYGLGTENQNLPGFIAMCPGGYPIMSTRNWRSAFLPGAYQGTYVNTQIKDPAKTRQLIANLGPENANLTEQRKQLDLLRQLNLMHQVPRAEDARLEARIQNFELAYRMQTDAAEAFDVTKETKTIQQAYGETTQGRQLLIARRLIERGVRFVQVWSGAGQPWDNHDNIATAHKKLADEWDPAIATFLADLKQRGLFDETLVLWGGEFGRTPVAEFPALSGRDHNHYGFTCWLAGGGVKGGTVYGATDEFGFRAVEKPVPVHDLHATMLHLLGFDHERLTYRYAGRDFRLTDVHGHVLRDILA
ncbi:MAG: DUF1501 domain-containing protein [Planctomycetaceae bacterium]|nr:DUF1501 domain-containing protein [Planctomycetaceae bacterium]